MKNFVLLLATVSSFSAFGAEYVPVLDCDVIKGDKQQYLVKSKDADAFKSKKSGKLKGVVFVPKEGFSIQGTYAFSANGNVSFTSSYQGYMDDFSFQKKQGSAQVIDVKQNYAEGYQMKCNYKL